MRIREIKPTVDADALLAGAQFADAFGLEVDGHTLDARQATERMVGRAPRWIDALVTLRNILVTPFGLKTSGAGATAPRDMIGIFPVISQTPDRLVAGFNDSHLDFRVVVDVAPRAPASRSPRPRWSGRTIGSGGLTLRSSCRFTGSWSAPCCAQVAA